MLTKTKHTGRKCYLPNVLNSFSCEGGVNAPKLCPSGTYYDLTGADNVTLCKVGWTTEDFLYSKRVIDLHANSLSSIITIFQRKILQ